jgi:hypothetical protein
VVLKKSTTVKRAKPVAQHKLILAVDIYIHLKDISTIFFYAAFSTFCYQAWQ